MGRNDLVTRIQQKLRSFLAPSWTRCSHHMHANVLLASFVAVFWCVPVVSVYATDNLVQVVDQNHAVQLATADLSVENTARQNQPPSHEPTSNCVFLTCLIYHAQVCHRYRRTLVMAFLGLIFLRNKIKILLFAHIIGGSIKQLMLCI